MSARWPPSKTEGRDHKQVGVIPAAIPQATKLRVPISKLSDMGIRSHEAACKASEETSRGKTPTPDLRINPVIKANSNKIITGI